MGKKILKNRDASKTSKRISIRFSPKLNKKKKYFSKKRIRKLNPNFKFFQIDSFFIYESRLFKYFYSFYKDCNKMKPKEEDIEFLQNNIQELKLIGNESLNAGILKIPSYFASFFFQYVNK